MGNLGELRLEAEQDEPSLSSAGEGAQRREHSERCRLSERDGHRVLSYLQFTAVTTDEQTTS